MVYNISSNMENTIYFDNVPVKHMLIIVKNVFLYSCIGSMPYFTYDQHIYLKIIDQNPKLYRDILIFLKMSAINRMTPSPPMRKGLF